MIYVYKKKKKKRLQNLKVQSSMLQRKTKVISSTFIFNTIFLSINDLTFKKEGSSNVSLYKLFQQNADLFISKSKKTIFRISRRDRSRRLIVFVSHTKNA